MTESMIRRAWRAAPLTCALCFVSLAAGCDTPPIAGDDAAIAFPDGSIAEDAGIARPDGSPGVCRTDLDCDDGDTCTENTCDSGECWSARVEGCFECAVDADCDDGFVCSIETCFGGVCQFDWDNERCDCTDDSHCDDGNPATTDRCADFRCVNTSRTCSSDAECDDMDPCTTDACSGSVCVSARIPGCGTSTCPDRDGDGHGSRYCPGGDDCDDADPRVHPGATEVCDDGLDNDCNGRADAVDMACATGGTTCAAAVTLVPGTPVDGAIVHDPAITTTGTCGASNFYGLAISETSDVEVTVTLMDPPPPTPVPGCPECTSDRMWEYWFNAYLETTCGDTTTDLGGAGGGCRVYSNDSWFGGSPTHTVSLRRVPVGSYSVEVQAQDFFGWMVTAIRYTVSVTVTPSDPPACGAAGALAEGVASSGHTGTGTDAFGTACAGSVVAAEEALHTFTLADRRRVRLEAVGTPDPTTMVEPGLRLGLYGACDPGATRVACLEHTGRECHARATMEEVLDPGTYWVVVEGTSAGDHAYGLTLSTEAVGAACTGATNIAASGAFMGDTTGAPDEFRDDQVCGDGYGPDRVYQVSVPVDSRVVLDLVASYSSSMVSLYRGCGEALIAGGRGRTRIDTNLAAGTYFAVVGGDHATDAGAYVLNATFVPTP